MNSKFFSAVVLGFYYCDKEEHSQDQTGIRK